MGDHLDIYVIPTAIAADKLGKPLVDATIVFRPGSTGNDSDGAPPILQDWPSALDKLLNRLSMAVYSINDDGTLGTLASTGAVDFSALASGHQARGGPNGKQSAASFLWTALVNPDASLAQALKVAANTTPTLLTQTAQNDPTAAPNDPPAPDVMSVPRAELAHLLTLQRAKVIADRIGLYAQEQPAGTTGAAPPPRGVDQTPLWAKSVKLETTAAHAGDAPVVGHAPDGTPIIAAVATEVAGAPVAASPSASTTMSRNNAKAALEAERAAHLADLNTKALGLRAYAKTIASSERSADRILAPTATAKARQQQYGVGSNLPLGAASARAAVNSGNGFADTRESCLATHVYSNIADQTAFIDSFKDAKPSKPLGDEEQQKSPDRALEDASDRWNSIVAFPSLQRVLQLVVDVKITFDKELPEGFVVLKLDLDTPSVSHRSFGSLVKISTKRGRADRSIWPCTLEELILTRQDQKKGRSAQYIVSHLRTSGAVDQIDGLLDLEARMAPDDPNAEATYRFSIEGLDVHAAAESEVQRDRAIAHVKDMTEPLNLTDEQANALGISVAGAAVERKMRSAGLQLIDQWRDSVAVKQHVRAYDLNEPHASDVLDADDLTIGLRLDLGAMSAKQERSWVCLTDRHAYFSLADSSVRFDVEAAINAVVSQANSGNRSRKEIDGVVIGQPSRLLNEEIKNNNESPPADQAKLVAFAESIVATWDGDPLGMRSGAASTTTDHLYLNMDFQLCAPAFGDSPGNLPFKQRFGAPYWLGARTVLIGGVVLPLEKARQLYDRADSFALPAIGHYRRFLRHEWVDAPMIATGWETVKREFEEGRGLDGGTMIIRSQPRPVARDAEPDDAWRFEPRKTTRMLFAPRVDFTFAHWHGVFDRRDVDERLRGGMRYVEFNGECGGFPVYSPEFAPGARPDYGEAPQKPTNGGTKFSKAPTEPPPSGLAVYLLRTLEEASPSVAGRYFPDPAARSFVVALRRPTEQSYLGGKPFIVSLYPDAGAERGVETPGYPHAAPLRLTTTAYEKTAKPIESHQDFKLRDGGLRPLAKIDPSKPHGHDNLLQELVLPLAPGEDFIAEIWALPSCAQICAWFDIPESMAFLASAGGPVGSPCARREDLLVALNEINLAAQEIHATLQMRPLPEFAAVRSLRLTHAVEQPSVDPTIDDYGPGAIRFRRVSAKQRDNILAPNSSYLLPDKDAPDASDILVEGELIVDRASFETVELWVAAAAPSGQALDDPMRGRSPEDRMRGDWPPEPQGKPQVSPSRLLYGFDVAEDGRVAWTPQNAIFGRWPLKIGGGIDQTLLNLQRQLVAAGKKDDLPSATTRPNLQRLFGDNGARRVTAWIAVTSRTARLIPERRLYPNADQTARDDRRRKRLSKPIETIVRSVVRPAALPIKSLLPAFAWRTDGANRWAQRITRIRVPFARPAMTSGVDERVGIVLWPPNLIRIIPGNPAKPDLAAGTIFRVEPLAATEREKREIPLTSLGADTREDWRKKGEIADDDLGPGGAFVSRWGADPIHAVGAMTWLIDAKAFSNSSNSEEMHALPLDAIATAGEDSGLLWPVGDTYRPRLVENVLMPIPLNSDDDGPDEKIAAAAEKAAPPPQFPSQFLMVSLMTYAPRFDADNETWHAEIDIDPGLAPDPFLRLGLVRFQPHADRELQVSHPVAEWVQVVGHSRGAKLSVLAADKAGKPTKVAVEIDNPTLPDMSEQSPLHIFSATLIERWRLDSGMIVEHNGLTKTSDNSQATDSLGLPSSSSDRVAWRSHFDLDRPTESGFVGYAVYVEERLRMRRAGAPAEPVSAETDLPWQDTGPRFAVKLEVPDDNTEEIPDPRLTTETIRSRY